jgi:hypothetical protein
VIQRPVASGLILCEQRIVEERTKNITLVHCFPRLNAVRFPAVAPRLVVYAALTDGLGDGSLRLNVERLETSEEIAFREQQIRFSDPLQEFRIFFHFRRLRFPAAGRYQFTLLADRELVAQQVLRVSLKEA